MSIYGSLFSSVSGIQAQATAIGIIADNISNVNTVGYKAGSQYFGTLVTNSGAGATYSPGGVRAQNRQLITQQGLVQASSNPLDVAISGNGFFVVQDKNARDGTETVSYTRAGAFRKDDTGKFQNAAGQYLLAWRVDTDGSLPTGAENLSTLQVVDIAAASGDAAATTEVSLGLNLKADEDVFLGAGDTGSPGADGTNTENDGVKGDGILIANANMAVGDEFRVTVNGATDYDFLFGGYDATNDILGGILGASTATEVFDSATEGSEFTITRQTAGGADIGTAITFTFKASNPNPALGEYNTLTSLADAINRKAGLTARVATNSASEVRMYVSAEDAREGLDFTHVSGSNFVTGLDLDDIAGVSSNRWNTMEGLAELVNNETGDNLTAEVLNADSTSASIKINNADPLTTIQFDSVDNAGGDGITTDFPDEFGLDDTEIDAAYDSGDEDRNMASGAIEAHFVRGVRVYDSIGEGHDLQVAFLKVSQNVWRAEIFAALDDDGNHDLAADTNLIAAGEIVFNGDGSLASVDSSLTTDIGAIAWSNEAETSNIVFDLGTQGEIGTGDTDGLRQFAGFYNVDFVRQDGVEAGLLDSVSIDKDGFVIANFSNGQVQKLYKIPLADFANPDGLIRKNGNVFIASSTSGSVNLKEAGKNGVGTLSPSSLESSNSELSEELTDMIVAQRAYQASAKVITTADELLDELNRVT